MAWVGCWRAFLWDAFCGHPLPHLDNLLPSNHSRHHHTTPPPHRHSTNTNSLFYSLQSIPRSFPMLQDPFLPQGFQDAARAPRLLHFRLLTRDGGRPHHLGRQRAP